MRLFEQVLSDGQADASAGAGHDDYFGGGHGGGGGGSGGGLCTNWCSSQLLTVSEMNPAGQMHHEKREKRASRTVNKLCTAKDGAGEACAMRNGCIDIVGHRRRLICVRPVCGGPVSRSVRGWVVHWMGCNCAYLISMAGSRALTSTKLELGWELTAN